jgi:hypothetical protein
MAADELAAGHLHLAYPEERNRTDRYMRRHGVRPAKDGTTWEPVDPNRPVRSPEEPPKIEIPAHLREMRRKRLIPAPIPAEDAEGTFNLEPTMIAVTISDLAANLLRPSFQQQGLGGNRLFYFKDEPIERKTYFCLCFFQEEGKPGRLECRQVRFDPGRDLALDPSGRDLVEEGLVWAAALVPLVMDGTPLQAVEIGQNDYDLRQILGRTTGEALRFAYEGWFDEWDARVARVVSEHSAGGRAFATFYHSIIAADASGGIHIRQGEGTLPGLAAALAEEGMVAAGLLDSGGSCALYDAWMASYLNHGWYFREPRGAILLFQLTPTQRLPIAPKSWVGRRSPTLPSENDG